MDHALLSLPHPADSSAEAAFREAYLSKDHPDPLELPNAFRDSREHRKLQSRLIAIGRSVFLKAKGIAIFSLSPVEAGVLADRVIACINRTLPEREGLFGFFGREHILRLAQEVLTFAVIPYLDKKDVEHVNRVRNILDVLDREGQSTSSSRIALLRIDLDDLPNVVSRLRQQIRSHRRRGVEDALMALGYWVKHGETWQVPAPPYELGLEAGFLVEDRWPPVLVSALQTAEALVREPTWRKDETMNRLLLKGLDLLLGEAAYDRPGASDKEAPSISIDDIPKVRAEAVKLATTLAATGLQGDAVIEKWLKAAENDPLPEVRHALRGHDASGEKTEAAG